MDDAYGSDKRRYIWTLPQRNFDERATLHLPTQCRRRQYRDSGPVLDGLLNVLDVVELRHDPHVGVVTSEKAIELPSAGQSTVEGNERFS